MQIPVHPLAAPGLPPPVAFDDVALPVDGAFATLMAELIDASADLTSPEPLASEESQQNTAPMAAVTGGSEAVLPEALGLSAPLAVPVPVPEAYQVLAKAAERADDPVEVPVAVMRPAYARVQAFEMAPFPPEPEEGQSATPRHFDSGERPDSSSPAIRQAELFAVPVAKELRGEMVVAPETLRPDPLWPDAVPPSVPSDPKIGAVQQDSAALAALPEIADRAALKHVPPPENLAPLPPPSTRETGQGPAAAQNLATPPDNGSDSGPLPPPAMGLAVAQPIAAGLWAGVALPHEGGGTGHSVVALRVIEGAASTPDRPTAKRAVDKPLGAVPLLPQLADPTGDSGPLEEPGDLQGEEPDGPEPLTVPSRGAQGADMSAPQSHQRHVQVESVLHGAEPEDLAPLPNTALPTDVPSGAGISPDIPLHDNAALVSSATSVSVPQGQPSHIDKETALPPAKQVAEAIVSQPDGIKPGRIELILAPDMLGRVQFDIQTDRNGLTITLSAERPETLDLIRRNLPDLVAELRQSGIEGAAFHFGSWNGKRQTPEPAMLQMLAADTPPPLPVERRPQSTGQRSGGAGLNMRL
ncbi:MAG: flagellar hook-length control protein FliK [Pseudorhodobacter sp.]|nr:MAG: flagellar hook-length control protein FliK [Pseudorhodobacter sp.]